MAGQDQPTLKLAGRAVPQPTLPRNLLLRSRSTTAAADPFLPPGYVQPVAAYDLSVTARSTEGGQDEKDVPTRRGEVIALELADGTVIYTSPENLGQTLRRVAPDAVTRAGGALPVDALTERASATRGMGDVVSNLVVRVTTLRVGDVPDAIIEAARRKLAEWTGGSSGIGDSATGGLAGGLNDLAELGVSWLGTKALLWAIESRLPVGPGLYRWSSALGETAVPIAPGDAGLESEARQGPLLVFIHGTASSTAGSFSELQAASFEYWRQFASRFGERIYAFEHRTLSESPIENALQLARALPARARLNLVTHSRGGLVGDLMCLDQLGGADRALIEAYAVDSVALGDTEGLERERLKAELEQSYGAQRAQLAELAALLRDKQFVIERYVRVAAPARGTRLASGNFDVFLSGLLALIGLVPVLAGSPIYAAFARVVLEIAKNRTRPNIVPGIEAMLPESPMARLLARATPPQSMAMAVIAGDIEGGGLLKRLGVFFTDHVLFDGVNNDLVVDTDSMFAGVARAGRARALFDQGPEVSHFRYFNNDMTRRALRSWLTEQSVESVTAFTPLSALDEASAALSASTPRSRGADDGASQRDTRPIVVLLPGTMGSHLWRNRKDRVWFDFDDLVRGGLQKIELGASGIEPEALFGMFYGDLAEHLANSHQVEPFPYDWRLPLDQLGVALRTRLTALLDATEQSKRPLRVLAHSMGGLVVRALIHQDPALWDRLMQREGARFVMLGTPNQGSHLMVETLLGKSSTIRSLGRMDLKHSLQQVLDIVGGFPGALQLLPRPGFADTGSTPFADYFREAVWGQLKAEQRDFWFGDQVAAAPAQQLLQAGRWLWEQDAAAGGAALPARHRERVLYVHGCASNTPCGLVKEGERWKLLGTPQGDGSVSWASGAIEGIGRRLWMPAEHGALADTEAYFESIELLLARGEPGQLMTAPPRSRDAMAAAPQPYEAGPPVYPTAVDLAAALIGRKPRTRVRQRPQPTLKVSVCAMDLRSVARPILAGHYEQDTISGAEWVIDRDLVGGALSVRYNLGLYAGALGTATVVLTAPNEAEQRRGSRRGAVIAGLGAYDGSLSVSRLTEAVRTAALRTLLHVVDTSPASTIDEAEEGGIALATLLLGYNSSANLGIDDSLLAIVRGVVEANRKFAESSTSLVRISDLQVVEIYLDTAISAAYALPRVAKLVNDSLQGGCRVEAATLLSYGEGVRQRLEDTRAGSYWARIVVTDADRSDDDCSPETLQQLAQAMQLAQPAQPTKTTAATPADGTSTASLVAAPDLRTPPWLRRRLGLAQRLRFLYLGQRARAETIVQQRQPGLVEQLVAQQLHVRTYQPDFSRTLFQLLVPHDFKDAARGLDRAVLVVDAYTANFPWEMMLASDAPVSVKAAIVRQFSSSRFRQRVQQTSEARALVIGNPSSAGFAAAFPNSKAEPPPLPAAEDEANTVAQVLAQYRYDVVSAIGVDQQAIDIVTRLYQQPYRVLHIAAHGVFEEQHADGTTRTGVVLSNGLLLTAAEIAAMEVVPDLVFLNCCHLGQMGGKLERAPTAYNRLAYSVARELIEMGVRAVVAAGWAVDDEAANLFAATFYRSLLGEYKQFGDAVWAARKAVWQDYPTSTTWGAYQAYGDPGWSLRSREDGYGASSTSGSTSTGGTGESANRWTPVAPEELLSEIEKLRMTVGRADHVFDASEQKGIDRKLRNLLRQVPEPSWRSRLDVCAAVGRLYADLGQDWFGLAAEHLQRAIEQQDRNAHTPIAAIEQLANMEACDGEARGDAARVERAIARLQQLLRVAAAQPESSAKPAPGANKERAGLLGSAYKRLAAVHAKAAVAATDATGRAAALRAMRSALDESERWYFGQVTPADATSDATIDPTSNAEPDPYTCINWLFLITLRPVPAAERAQRQAFAQRCAAVAAQRFGDEADFWSAITAADVALVQQLLDGAQGGSNAPAVMQAVAQAVRSYQDVLQGLAVRPKQLQSTVQQLCLMALFNDALAGGRKDAHARTAASLREIADALMPGVCAQARLSSATASSASSATASSAASSAASTAAGAPADTASANAAAAPRAAKAPARPAKATPQSARKSTKPDSGTPTPGTGKSGPRKRSTRKSG